jgi:hypothetical protein
MFEDREEKSRLKSAALYAGVKVVVDRGVVNEPLCRVVDFTAWSTISRSPR